MYNAMSAWNRSLALSTNKTMGMNPGDRIPLSSRYWTFLSLYTYDATVQRMLDRAGHLMMNKYSSGPFESRQFVTDNNVEDVNGIGQFNFRSHTFPSCASGQRDRAWLNVKINYIPKRVLRWNVFLISFFFELMEWKRMWRRNRY